MAEPIRLRAVDEEDIAVLGTVLQDALVPVGDMRYMPKEKQFVLVANRFCWECMEEAERAGAGAAEEGGFLRVHCGLSVENVTKVEARGFKPGDPADVGRLLEVLTFAVEDGALVLVFAGGAAVRLTVDSISVYCRDVGEPWPTLWRPQHDADEELDKGGGTR